MNTSVFNTASSYNPNNHYEVQPTPNDAISALEWHPKADFLLASSWDRHIRLWELKNEIMVPIVALVADEPILSCCWNDDGTKGFFGGCDSKVFCWDPASNSKYQVAEHEKPVKLVKWLPKLGNGLLVTGSWDKTIKFWDCRQASPALVIQLPDRLYCADLRDEVAVVATADRHVLIYNLANPQTPHQVFQSPLKFQSRCCKIFLDKTGFVLGSIAGQVAIHHLLESDEQKNFTFRCHRDKTVVYSVNDIAFHPTGIFATCGSDGAIMWWNKDSRNMVQDPFKNCSLPVTTCSWNRNGTVFSYAVGYDWSQGTKYALENQATLKYHILLTKGTPD